MPNNNNNRWRGKRPNNKEQENYIPPFDASVLAEPIESLALSSDLTTKLKAGKVNIVLDVVKRSEQDLFKITTFNKKNLFEVKGVLLARKMFLRPQEKVEKPEGADANGAAASANNNGATSNSAPQQNNRPKEGARQPLPNKENNGNLEQGYANKNAKPQNSKNNRLDDKSDNKDFNRNNKNTNFRDDKRNSDQRKDQLNKNKKPKNDDVSEHKTKAEREKLRPPKPVVVQSKDIYLKINKNAKWGFADRSGKEVVAPIYDEVFSYKEELCCVELADKFGFIDRNGEEIIPVIYETACSFSEGYACVCKNGSCGYINKQNETVVDFKFDAGTAVVDGNCRVKKDGKWGELFIDNPSEIRWIL